LFFGEFGCLMN